ncbi:MAG: hypothetical protein M0R21_07875 [Lentimicrobiaceae bacterium]|nr:hypothetical protein [Lentimicrobiaceae bacterium]
MINHKSFIRKSVQAGVGCCIALSINGASSGRIFPDKKGEINVNVSTEDPAKPNIIFFMTDQQRWDAIVINNPHEWKNLYSNKKYQKIREQLKTELLENMAVTFPGFPMGKG